MNYRQPIRNALMPQQMPDWVNPYPPRQMPPDTGMMTEGPMYGMNGAVGRQMVPNVGSNMPELSEEELRRMQLEMMLRERMMGFGGI